jgi:hypothetical protein
VTGSQLSRMIDIRLNQLLEHRAKHGEDSLLS